MSMGVFPPGAGEVSELGERCGNVLEAISGNEPVARCVARPHLAHRDCVANHNIRCTRVNWSARDDQVQVESMSPPDFRREEASSCFEE